MKFPSGVPILGIIAIWSFFLVVVEGGNVSNPRYKQIKRLNRIPNNTIFTDYLLQKT